VNDALALAQSGSLLDAAFIVAVEFLLLMLIWGLLAGAALLTIHLLPGRRWRHRDPTIRRAAVEALDVPHDATLAGWIARNDIDDAVREAAQRLRD
jgi:hypothetical protein